MSPEEREQMRKSEAIEKEMADAYFEEMEKIKLLLLGEFSLRCSRATSYNSYNFACSCSFVRARECVEESWQRRTCMLSLASFLLFTHQISFLES